MSDETPSFGPRDVDLSKHLQSCFGCVEFERAIVYIVQYLADDHRNAGIPESLYGNGPAGWGKKLRMETVGIDATTFAMLCAAGWLRNCWFPKGAFVASPELIERLREKAKNNNPIQIQQATPTMNPTPPTTPGSAQPAMTKQTWSHYKRKGLSEMRPYESGEDISHVSVSEPDRLNGSPKLGDMIARNPKNHADQWLVAKKYFEDNLEPASP